MQTSRVIQAVALMMFVAFAASCATTNQYVSKLFSPRPVTVKDTQSMAIKFLELDKLDADKQSWVRTDIVKDKDSTTEDRTIPIVAETKPTPIPEESVAKATNPDGTRIKRSRE